MFDMNNRVQVSAPSTPLVDVQPILRNVYMWMVLGLLLTAGIGWVLAETGLIIEMAMNIPFFFIGVIIAQFGVVIYLSMRLMKMRPTTALMWFFVYAALMGVTLSSIFLAFTAGEESIAPYSASAVTNAFLTTAGLFGAMTVVGFTTKIDLTKFHSFLMMGLIGLVIAMFVNMLIGSAMIDFIISVVGVLLFTGLTAYDTQKIKNWAADPQIAANADAAGRLAVMGALSLYLDFINLFLFLLRLFGGRD